MMWMMEFAVSLVVFGPGDAGMPKIDPFSSSKQMTPRIDVPAGLVA